MDKPLLRRARDCRTARIKPADTNKFVMLVDPAGRQVAVHLGRRDLRCRRQDPRHHHGHAHEMFDVLSGRGKAHCNGEAFDMEKGDTLMLPPGLDHVVENVGPEKLYCLTVMVPNEGFAEMIRDGETMSLDAADRAVVSA